MLIVYHPASWAQNWPKGAKPYASKPVAVAHGHTEESLIETAFNGPVSDVISEAPKPATEESSVPAESATSSVPSVLQDTESETAKEAPKAPKKNNPKTKAKK